MNSILSLGSYTRSIGLAAFVAMGAVIAIGLASPARAASDYLLELDGIDGEFSAKSEEMGGKLTELDALFSSIQEQLARAEQLKSEIITLDEEIEAVRKQGTEQQEYFTAQLQDARTVFTEQVASFLDPEVVEAVSINFQKIEFEYKPQRDSDASGEGGRFRYHQWTWSNAAGTEFDSNFDELQAVLQKVKEATYKLQSGFIYATPQTTTP